MTGLIKQKFDQLKHDNKKAVIPFITADYPNRDEFLRLLNELPAHGASMIEIGIPFSDPMADGEVIQKTSQQAIQQGFQLKNLLMDIKTFKANHPTTPIILMTYANPLIQFGIDQFLVESEASGVDGLLLVDVPPNQHHTVIKTTTSLDMIRLITATTDIDRLPIIQANASGFIYYVSVKGITGTQIPDVSVVNDHLAVIQNHIQLPTVIGFGIANKTIAKEMASISDGIIIGSAFLKPFLNASESDYEIIRTKQLAFIHSIASTI